MMFDFELQKSTSISYYFYYYYFFFNKNKKVTKSSVWLENATRSFYFNHSLNSTSGESESFSVHKIKKGIVEKEGVKRSNAKYSLGIRTL